MAKTVYVWRDKRSCLLLKGKFVKYGESISQDELSDKKIKDLLAEKKMCSKNDAEIKAEAKAVSAEKAQKEQAEKDKKELSDANEKAALAEENQKKAEKELADLKKSIKK